jgi:hypothetical protein
MNNIYFTALVNTAAGGAELATALAGTGNAGGSMSWSHSAPSRTTRT